VQTGVVANCDELFMSAIHCPALHEAVKDNPAAKAELAAILKKLERLDELEALVLKLQAQFAEFTSNSRTSSKPPSSDRHNINKPQPKSLRKSSGRRPGGQMGHQGRTLEMEAQPDEVVEHDIPSNCPQCGAFLEDAPKKQEAVVERRQVIEIEPAAKRVVEHRCQAVRCPYCQALIKAGFPHGVNAPVQYGLTVQAVATYLSVSQLLPSHRAAEVMGELCGCPISAGSVATMMSRAAEGAIPVVEEIKGRLLKEKSAGFDETGLSLNGKMHWLHTASSSKWTVLHTHEKRGQEGIAAGGILPKYHGRAVHDFLAAYYCFVHCIHALCNAHHLRDLRFVAEVLMQDWAQQMKDLLVETKVLVDERRRKKQQLSDSELDELQHRYLQIVAHGYEYNPEPPPKSKGQRGRVARGKALNLLDRFATRSEEVMAFALDSTAPFDNNHAERDLRMMKIRQKISGCFRSADVLSDFARVRSVISTSAKHGVGALDAINILLSPTPSLAAILDLAA
jgi:transposase